MPARRKAAPGCRRARSRGGRPGPQPDQNQARLQRACALLDAMLQVAGAGDRGHFDEQAWRQAAHMHRTVLRQEQLIMIANLSQQVQRLQNRCQNESVWPASSDPARAQPAPLAPAQPSMLPPRPANYLAPALLRKRSIGSKAWASPRRARRCAGEHAHSHWFGMVPAHCGTASRTTG